MSTVITVTINWNDHVDNVQYQIAKITEQSILSRDVVLYVVLPQF